MAERTLGQVWGMRLAFLALAGVILFSHLLPLETTPRRWAAPVLLVALCFAWALRRPDYVPAIAVAGVMLLADLLLQRPPGLWALLVLLATEWLKRRDRHMRDTTFLAEWVTVAAVLLGITLAYRLVLSLLIVSSGMLFLSLMQFGMTVLAYPVVAALSHVVFRVRRASPGELDPLGRKT